MIASIHIVHQSCKFLIYSHKTMQIMECMEETGIVPGVIDKFAYKIRDNMTNNENRFQSFFY